MPLCQVNIPDNQKYQFSAFTILTEFYIIKYDMHNVFNSLLFLVLLQVLYLVNNMHTCLLKNIESDLFYLINIITNITHTFIAYVIV